jgi:hypothetical protein
MRCTSTLLAILGLLLTRILLVSAQHGNGQKFDRDQGLQSALQFLSLHDLIRR